MTLSAPFPYFGGKKRWADKIWLKFGKAVGPESDGRFGIIT